MTGQTYRVEIDRLWDGTPIPADQRASVTFDDQGTFTATAPFRGDPAPAEPPGRTPGLWHHEVVELFLAGDDLYVEVELSPHGHYLALRFRETRRAIDEALTLDVRVAHAAGWWTARTKLSPLLLPRPTLRTLAAWLSGPHDARRYALSASLPGPRPDFHQPDTWPALASHVQRPNLVRQSGEIAALSALLSDSAKHIAPDSAKL